MLAAFPGGDLADAKAAVVHHAGPFDARHRAAHTGAYISGANLFHVRRQELYAVRVHATEVCGHQGIGGKRGVRGWKVRGSQNTGGVFAKLLRADGDYFTRHSAS